MTRWRLFWAAYIAVGVIVDPLREQADITAGRTHSDGTTLSATTRWTVEHVPGGRVLFAAGCVLIPRWFETHILDHLDNRKADW